jgi:hypothetical protein
MSTVHIPAIEPRPAARGILAVLVADREVRIIIEDDSVAARAARPQSVIDRARETLTRRASTS